MTFKFKQIRIYKRSLNQEPFSNTRKKQNCSKQSCKKRNREILRELTFANICAISFFSAQRCYTAKDIFCVSFRKNCAKVLWMKTISLKSYSCPIFYIELSSRSEYAQINIFKLCLLSSVPKSWAVTIQYEVGHPVCSPEDYPPT